MIRIQNEKDKQKSSNLYRTRPLTWQQKKVILDECFKDYKKSDGER